jgi:hypothetical protein
MNTPYLRRLKDRLTMLQATAQRLGSPIPQPVLLEIATEMLDQLIQTQDRLSWLESSVRQYPQGVPHEATP